MIGGIIMRAKPLLPADTFVVVNKTILNEKDRKLLIMLYQPLIGSTAISLYFTLWTYLDKSEVMSIEWTHHHLMTNMRLRLDDILESREKLEAIGLLKTYVREDHIHEYVYELYSPISAYEFLNNPILGNSLYRNIGNQEYQKTIDHFKIPKWNTKGYQNTSCTFGEIFESSNVIETEIETKEIKRVSQLGLAWEPKIDLNSVLSLFPEELLNPRSMTKDLRDLVYKLAFIYDLNEEAMRDMIRNAINEKRSIDPDKLKNQCRNYYQFENSGKLPSIVFRNQPEYLRKPVGDQSNRAKMIYMFETTSPYDFLLAKNKGARPNKNETDLISYLLIDLDLKPGVVNVLLDYVLKINGNKLIKSFVEVIATQWKRSNVETVEAAMQIAELEHSKKKQPSVKSPKILEKKPDWFDLKAEISLASEEEIKALDAKLKRRNAN